MKKLLLTAVLGSSLFIPAFAAATDGTLGSTSTASMSISLTSIDNPASEIQITGLQDIDFGDVEYSVTPSPITVGSICVYLSTASTYSISLDGNGNSPSVGSLHTDLSGGTRLFRYYSFEYTDPDGNIVNTSDTMSGLRGSASPECSLSETASLTIEPFQSDAGQRLGGNTPDRVWTGTMNITVSPD